MGMNIISAANLLSLELFRCTFARSFRISVGNVCCNGILTDRDFDPRIFLAVSTMTNDGLVTFTLDFSWFVPECPVVSINFFVGVGLSEMKRS